MAGHTIDVDAVAQVVRRRLLLTRSTTESPTLAERLSGGLHDGTPPDNADYPYGAVRILNVHPYPIDGPYYSADAELQLFFRPRSEFRALRQATDVAVEAMVGWVDLAAGVYRVEARDSDVLPPFPEAADPEVIASRTMFSLVLFPAPTP